MGSHHVCGEVLYYCISNFSPTYHNNKTKINTLYFSLERATINETGLRLLNNKNGEDKMKVSKEELLHIAKLANLNIKDEEIDKYLLNLQDILNFANIVNNAPVEGLTESFGVNENYNVFRKDEIKVFEDNEALLANAPEKERNMFKIPKVIQ